MNYYVYELLLLFLEVYCSIILLSLRGLAISWWPTSLQCKGDQDLLFQS